MIRQPKLPDYITVPSISSNSRSGNKLSAGNINSINTKTKKLTLAAEGSVLPIVYGEAQVDAKVVGVFQQNNDLIFVCVWCHGEIEEVSHVFIDGKVNSSVTVTSYVGTSNQTVDTTLASIISGFDDAYPDVAYSVVRVPPSLSKIPNISAQIKGKIIDVDGNLQYSDNTARCLADFIQNPVYGCGLPLRDSSDSFAFNDDLMPDKEPRCRIGIVFDKPTKSWKIAELLAEYAECYLVWEGFDVRIVPDKPSPVSYEFGEDVVVAQSVKVSIGDLTSSPNQVEVRYTDTSPKSDSMLWGTASEKIQLIDILSSDIGTISSSVSFDGIFRQGEAFRKAYSRLYRPLVSGKFQWNGFDESIRVQVGDVVLLNLPSLNIYHQVRVTRVYQTDYGRYRFEGVAYSSDAYPPEKETPLSSVPVPVGCLAIKLYGDTPNGWEDFTSLSTQYIRGYAPNLSNGSKNVTLTGVSSLSGSHTGVRTRYLLGGGDQDLSPSVFPKTEGSSSDVHTHNIDFTVQPNIHSQPVQLVKCVNTQALVPENLAVFSSSMINDPLYQRILSFGSGALCVTDNPDFDKSSDTLYQRIETDSVSDHTHTETDSQVFLGDSTDEIKYSYESSGLHSHYTDVEVVSDLLKTSLLLYSASEPYKLRQGTILMFPVGTPIPYGFTKCEGSYSTPDLRGKYIYVETSVTPNQTIGSNILRWTGLTLPSGAHEHNKDYLGSSYDMYTTTESLHGSVDGSHVHRFSGDTEWIPETIDFEFYQYTGDL